MPRSPPWISRCGGPAPGVEQLDAGYGYGSHWRDKPNQLLEDLTMLYPGDPPLYWAAQTILRNERIVIYPYAMVAVVQADGSFLIQRMD
jgi:hypothetical protein